MWEVLIKIIAKIEKLYDRLRNVFLTDYPTTVWSVIKFFLNGIFTYSIFAISFYISLILNLPQKQHLTSEQWAVIFIGSLILLFITYFLNKLRDWRKNRRLSGDKIIYDIIGGAIQELMELHVNKPAERARYTIEILNNVEKVIESIFRADGIEVGTLCANLMVLEGEHLKLIEFGTKFQDRDKPQVIYNGDNPLPGAPQAWAFNKVIYIEDIRSDKFISYFRADFKFRSFISVPMANDGIVFAILNVDSNIEKQFKSDDYIAKNIIPKINPFLLLFSFEQELLRLQNGGGNDT